MKKKLLDQLRDEIPTRHYSIRTEEAYTQWVKRPQKLTLVLNEPPRRKLMGYLKLNKQLIIILTILALGTAGQSQMAGSNRSRRVVQKLKPVLSDSLQAKGFCYGAKLFIRIFKNEKELELWLEKDSLFYLYKIYPICYFSGSFGPKLRRGDLQSPEGFYYVKKEQLNPYSQFHLSFNIGYPNAYDRAHKRTGGLIMIHGDCVSIGCYAMTNKGIEEIYTLAQAALNNGQSFFRVHIFPFRMTENNIKKYAQSKWIDFWKNLKTGFDYLEKNKLPPNVVVRDKKYVFEKEKD